MINTNLSKYRKFFIAFPHFFGYWLDQYRGKDDFLFKHIKDPKNQKTVAIAEKICKEKIDLETAFYFVFDELNRNCSWADIKKFNLFEENILKFSNFFTVPIRELKPFISNQINKTIKEAYHKRFCNSSLRDIESHLLQTLKKYAS